MDIEGDKLKAKIKSLEEEISDLKKRQNESASQDRTSSLFTLAANATKWLDADQRTFFKNILETLSEGIVACDNDYNFTLFNRATELLTGRKNPVEHIPPEKWAAHFNLYDPETKQLMPMDRLPLYRALQGEQVRNVHLLIMPQGQEPVHTLVIGGPIINNNGEKIGALIVSHDITCLKEEEEERLLKAQAELAEKVEASMKELAEANIYFSLSVDMFCIADFTGAFKRLNAAWEKTVGWTTEELCSRGWEFFVHPDDIPAAVAEGQKVMYGQDITACETRFLCKDGSYKWLLWSAKPMFEKQLIYVVAHDITERKVNEEEIKRLNANLEKQVDHLEAVNLELESLTGKLEQTRDQAVEASKLKSEFIANISHEIRTPLAGVIGMTELLCETALNTEQKTLTTTIRESAHSLLTIISDILDFSKIEAGRIELEEQDFDLVSLVDSSLDLLSASAKQKQLELKTEIDSRIPRKLKGDMLRIKQVLLNLLSNAIKFTEEGSITIGVIPVAADDSQVTVRFSVEDSGIGLTEKEQARLFEPFVQADGSTTREYGGTGLGLSICKRLVQLMGGTIGLQSEKGVGSKFWFTITIKVNQKSKSLLAGKTLLNRQQLLNPLTSQEDTSVLVVEDNPVLQDLVCRQLSKLGTHCDVASNGIEALAALTEKKYSLILMDVQMPEMDGYETTKLIRQQQKQNDHGSRTPIVAMTASAMAGEEEKCLAAGMDSYLCKPVSLYELSLTLGRWLPNQSTIIRDKPPLVAGKDGEILGEIDQLLALYGKEQTQQILASFQSEFERLLISLSEVRQQADKKRLATISHDLKGLCSVLPAKPMLSVCQQLEQMVSNPSWSKIEELQAQLTNALHQFQAEIETNS
jgi:PAS domain S-box-containing protein